MTNKRKTIAIGRVLVASREIDTVRNDNQKLQSLLGKTLYYQKGGKWYYDTEKLKRKSISELNELADEIEKA